MGNKSLSTLREEVNVEINSFIEKYYIESETTQYLNNYVLKYIKTFRYWEDDVRPILVRLGWELIKEKNKGHKFSSAYILPAMAAIHSIVLSLGPIDDLIDGAFEQDFKKTDELAEKISLAYSINTKLREGGRSILRKYYGDLENYLEIEELISECLERFDGSHALDVVFSRKVPLKEFTIKDYFRLIDEATSVFIATPLVIGGLIAGADLKTKRLMWDLGVHLGRLCQIRDDFLDYLDNNITGKIPFSDLLGKKRRLPLLLAYKAGTKVEKKLIEGILDKDRITSRDVLVVMELITSEKVRKKALNIVMNVKKKAERKLKMLPGKEPAKSTLLELIELFSEL